MDRGSLSLYGLSVITVLILFIFLTASVTIANDSVANTEMLSNEVLNSAQDFEDLAKFDSSEYSIITIRYVFDDNSMVKDPYSVYVRTGEKYYIEHPEINGYTANQKNITGVAAGDIGFTVLYTADKIA